MKFFLLLLVFGLPWLGWAQYQPWKNIEPGVYQFRGLLPPIRNTFLVDDEKDGFFLINTPYNSADQAAMINSIRTDFPQKKLKGIFILEHDYASAAGAFLVTSALGKVPVYSHHNLTFSEEEKFEYLGKNPKNLEAGKISSIITSTANFPFLGGQMQWKNLGTSYHFMLLQPSGTMVCPSQWLETPYSVNPQWKYKSMVSDYGLLLSQNPSRIFGAIKEVAYPKFQLWEILNNWERWLADYEYRVRSKMNFEEFRKSMNQRKAVFPWVPTDEKSLEILWKTALSTS